MKKPTKYSFLSFLVKQMSAILLCFVASLTSVYSQKMLILSYKENPIPFYMNCGNEVLVNIENYSLLDNIRIEAEGADILKSTRTGIFTIIPKSEKVTIKAYENEKLIAENQHLVKLLPTPTIALFLDNFVFNQRQTYLKDHLDTIMVKAVMPPNIQEEMPKDTNYKVSEFEVFILRGANVINELASKEEKINLTELLKSAKVGDFLSIEIKKVERLNFRGEIENVLFEMPTFTIQIN
jgi:hypothetical protein